MRDLQTVAAQCLGELESLGITCGRVEAFRVNTRAKKRWGLCKRTPGGFVIEIAAVLLEDDVPLASLKNTLIHELLHTCPGCDNHGDKWKSLAERVNQAYGYNIRRLVSPEEKGLSELPAPQAKYRFVCQDCGGIVERLRSSNFTRDPGRYRCGKCGGRFKRVL